MNQSTEVLEEVANDLIRMGDEIEQQISVPASEKTDKTAPTRPAPCVPTPSGTEKTVFPNTVWKRYLQIRERMLQFQLSK